LNSFQLVSIVLNFKFLYFSFLSQDSSVSEMTEYEQDDRNLVSDMDRNVSLFHHIQTVCEIYPTSRPLDVRNLNGVQQKLNIHIYLLLQSYSALCLCGEEARHRIFLDSTKYCSSVSSILFMVFSFILMFCHYF